jgi:protein-L-isoaspartate(D-aspartate) O-methyltransferase
MVDEQLRARGIRDERVLEAMGAVQRHLFVEPGFLARAYGDHALPSEHGQTISQPYIVGRMLELLELEAGHVVLEVGTGTGYQTALLARLARRVLTIERIGSLLEAAKERLAAIGTTNVAFRLGDGTLGWREFAPYDRVVVAAAAPRVPEALRTQLADRGLMVIPIGGPQVQYLEVWRREPGDRWTHDRHGECRFVPLLGHDAWPDAPGTIE